MFQFTSWPDQGVPDSPITMAFFINAVRRRAQDAASYLAPSSSSSTSSPPPIVVHGSASVGRTGTFITLWNLLDEAASNNCVNVFDAVRHVREFRFQMVQTADQYVFLHRALAVALQPELRSHDDRDDLRHGTVSSATAALWDKTRSF